MRQEDPVLVRRGLVKVWHGSRLLRGLDEVPAFLARRDLAGCRPVAVPDILLRGMALNGRHGRRRRHCLPHALLRTQLREGPWPRYSAAMGVHPREQLSCPSCAVMDGVVYGRYLWRPLLGRRGLNI